MTLVVFPFRHDDADLLERSIGIAASHPAVTRVLAVGDVPPDDATREVAARASEKTHKPVEVIVQERIGTLRPGKGDAMLTGLSRFLGDPKPDRIHFYDSDIRTFSASWIERAENALDAGADVAKHFFHRSPTDAQITWHLTKAGAAMLWPRSRFPDVHQPLGGEFALTRRAAIRLWESPQVRERSDWGIDTVLTFSMIQQGLALHEVFVAEGKEHGYYGSLTDLAEMLWECLDALQRLAPLDLPEGDRPTIDDEGTVSKALRDQVAYDVAATTRLLATDLSPAAQTLVEAFPELVPLPVAAWDDRRWARALGVLLAEFRLGNPAWEELAFRSWVSRVLHHTTVNVPLGYEASMGRLQTAVEALRG